MIHANDAKAMLKANIQKDEDAIKARVNDFLENECDSAIKESIELRSATAFVEVPNVLEKHTSLIVAMLMANGYKAQCRHGIAPAILIMWN